MKTRFPWHPGRVQRRAFLRAVGAAVAGLALPSAGCDRRRADTDAGTETDTVPAEPLSVPPLLEGEVEGDVRVFRLDLQTGTVDFGAGAPTDTWGANGAFLGPTLRFRRGERVRIEVTNGLAETTTLHWHGVHAPARADGGPYQTVAPGATWVSEYDVDQRPLTAWYHPHQMHMTARHVYMGIAGLILVDDAEPRADLPSTYGVDDLPLVIQDRRFFSDGTHPYSEGESLAMHDMMAGVKGETLLVNGVIEPTGAVPRGLVRFRVLNGSNARNYHLGFADDRAFQLIATDGGLLSAPLSTTRVLLAPGERAEILVDFSADATGASVVLQSSSEEVVGELFTGQMGTNIADDLDRSTFPIATFVIGEPPAAEIVPPTAFEAIPRMVEADAVRTREIVLAMGQGEVTINGEQMTDMDDVPDAIDFAIPAGDVELWVVTNAAGMAHPLHLHNRQFQVLDVDGEAPPPELAGWKDTVLVRPGQVVRLLIPFDGTPDAEFPYMFHCHILEHEDHGMMGRFFLV